MEMKEDVVIVGGGVAGLATAVALKRVGVRALVLERSKELRVTGAALTLFPNAWIALDALGVSHKLTTIYSPFTKGIITNVANGTTSEVSFAGAVRDKKGPIAVHRRALLEALADELSPDTIRFSSKLKSIETHKQDEAKSSPSSTPLTTVCLDDGTTIQTKVLIGCDGVHSVVARYLGLKDPVHSGRSAIRGLAVFPEGHGLEHEVLQFVEKGRRGGIAPLTDKELYWFMTYHSDPNKETHKEMATGDPKLIQKAILEDSAGFPSVYLDVVRHSDLPSLTWAPLMFRYPWNLIFGPLSKGGITVAGDAMHPMTPDLGQGGCQALEDAVVLGRHIGNSFLRNGRTLLQEDVAKSLEMYIKERKWRTALMITGSYISGWAQQAGGGGGSSGGESGWLMRFIRDTVFYKTLFRRFVGFAQYDCGKLPTSSSFESGNGHHQDQKKD